ncbi:MAG: MFS transporter [Rickettsiaceae bacterium]
MKKSSVFTAAIIGNILEYYDFTVYIVFSSVIGRTFFSAKSEFIQILSSLIVFAVGFITRPIGGLFFGYIGDRYGRRQSLIISMLGMTIPTFTIGLIPSYNDIGIYAPIILLAMRLIQGLCISGEGAGTAIFILEHHHKMSPGFTAGFVHGSNIAGTLIAAFIGIIIEQYFHEIHFMWRFAFLLGGFMGIVGFYLRLKVSETPIFQEMLRSKKMCRYPFLHVAKTAWRSMLVTCCIGAVASSALYLVKTYVYVFYNNVMHLDPTTSLIYLMYTSFVSMLFMPIFGGFADLIGKFRMMNIAIFIVFALILPIFYLMSLQTMWQQVIGLTLLGIVSGGVSGTAYIFIISIFKPQERFSGVAFSYNLGITIFGPTSAIMSRWLVEKTQLFYSPGIYIMSIDLVVLIIIFFMRNKIKQSIYNF